MMRISRNFDDNPEPDPDPGGDFDSIVEVLLEEIDDFRAAADAAGPILADEPASAQKWANPVVQDPGPSEPAPPVPDERLVEKHRRTSASDSGSQRMPRWVRVVLPRSVVVVTLTAVVAQSQPVIVAVPVAVYGLGWTAYLAWDAAYRPPLIDVAAAAAYGLTHVVIAVADLAAHVLRVIADRAHEVGSRRKSTSPERTQSND